MTLGQASAGAKELTGLLTTSKCVCRRSVQLCPFLLVMLLLVHLAPGKMVDSGFCQFGECDFFRSGSCVFLLGQLRVHLSLEFAECPIALALSPETSTVGLALEGLEQTKDSGVSVAEALLGPTLDPCVARACAPDRWVMRSCLCAQAQCF